MGKVLRRLTKACCSWNSLLFVGLLICIELVALPANLTRADSTTVVLKTIDEEAFQEVLFNMHIGMQTINFNLIATGSFLSYGWTFFIINGLATYPSYLLHSDLGLILIPRLISTASAALSIFLLYSIALNWLTRSKALLLSSIALLMSSFWNNAFWMHPDHLVTTALLATIYFFLKDRCTFKKYFIIGLVCLGIGLTIKLTALLYCLIVGIYVVYGTLIYPAKKRLWLTITYGVLSIGVIVATFILFNPTVFYPHRLPEIIQSMKDSVQDNKMNHGSELGQATLPNIITQVIEPFFMPIVLVILVIGLYISGIIYELRQRVIQPVAILSGSWFIFFLFYNITQVNKLWEHYYLPVFMVAPLAFICLTYWRRTKEYAWHIVIGVILLQSGLTGAQLIQVFQHNTSLHYNRDYNVTIDVDHEQAVADAAVQFLHNHHIQPLGVLTSPWVPFPKTDFHLTYNTYHRIYGYLSDDVIKLSGLPDIIIIDKAENYFKSPDDPTIVNQSSYSATLAGQIYLDKLMSGDPIQTTTDQPTYKVVKNNDLVLILQKIPYAK